MTGGNSLIDAQYSYKYFGAFRLLMALIVVVSHFQQDFAAPWLGEILNPLAIGNVGVVTFFALSGYVISEALTVFYAGRLKHFLINRALRIYPPFMAALLFSLAVHVILFVEGLPILGARWSAFNFDAMNFVALFDVRIPAASEDYYLFVRYVWAVVTEVHFYIAAGLMFAMSRLLVTKPAARRRLFVFYVCGTIGLYMISTRVPMPPVFKLVEFSPYFLVGVCLYHLNRETGDTGRPSLLLSASTGIALVLSLVCFALYTAKVTHVVNRWSLTAYGLSIGCFYVLASRNIVGNATLRKYDTLLGALSYPLYLNHYAVEVLILGLVQGPSGAAFWSGIVLSLAISWILNLAVEPVTARARNRIRGQVLAH